MVEPKDEHIALRHEVNNVLQVVRIVLVVAIEIGDVLAASIAQAHVPGPAGAKMLVGSQDANARVAFAPSSQAFQAVIGRGIINRNQFPV